jgi:hypothetical protein
MYFTQSVTSVFPPRCSTIGGVLAFSFFIGLVSIAAMLKLGETDVKRITIKHDPTAFPSAQAYWAQAAPAGDFSMWWDLSYLYDRLNDGGMRLEKKYWLRNIRTDLMRCGVPHQHFRIGEAAEGQVSNVADSYGFVRILMRTIDSSQNASVVDDLNGVLKKLAERAIEAYGAESHLVPETAELCVDNIGIVHGFEAYALQHGGPHIHKVVAACWADMGLDAFGNSRIGGDRHLICELVAFSSNVFKERRKRKKKHHLNRRANVSSYR